MPYKDPDKQREYQRKWMQKSNRNRPSIATKRFFIFRSSKLKERARNKGVDFDLSGEYLSEIWPEDGQCPALKIKMEKGTEGMSAFYSPSIDRINPNLGYLKGNVQWVSKLANQIMSNATPDQVIMVGEYFKKITKELENEKAFQQR